MPAKSWKDLMNEAEEGAKEFALLDEGMYNFVIKDAAKVGQTSKENPKFSINPSVESGPRANARVWHDFSVSDSPYAMKTYFFGELANLGLGADFFDTNPTEQQIAQALQGKRFVAQIFHETGNDSKVRAKIVSGSIQPPVGAAPAAGTPSGLPSAAPLGAPAGLPAPVAQTAPVVAPQAPSGAPEKPWGPVAAAAPAPAPAANTVPLPPSFG
jgi:hypothetical protein